MKRLLATVFAIIGLTAVMTASDGRCAVNMAGVALYAAECEVCHGMLASSTKLNRTAAQIQAAINGNAGGMGYLTYLAATDVQNVASALSTGAAAPVTGPDLYASYCGGCHGALASSTKKNRTAAQIQSAITGNAGGMGYLKTLTATQVQLIASALSGTLTTAPAPMPTPTPTPAPAPAPAPTDGAALYGTSCAGCHGTLASSTKKNRTAAQIQSAITGNVGGMGYLGTLTATEVQAIAAALSGTTAPAPAPVTAPTAPANVSVTAAAGSAGTAQAVAGVWSDANGAANLKLVFVQAGTAAAGGTFKVKYDQAAGRIYMTNDAGTAWLGGFAPGSVNTITNKYASLDCSKTTASRSGNNLTVSFNLKPAAAFTGSKGLYGFAYDMGMLATKSWRMGGTWTIGAAGTAPTAPAIDGAALYGTSCAGCHGALASSTKKGRTAAQIQAAITGNVGGMGYLGTLSAAEVQAIAAALAGTSTAPTAPAPVITDGATLYTNSCAGCHGALANSNVKGSSASNITSAISQNKGGMSFLSGVLTPEQIAAIAGVL